MAFKATPAPKKAQAAPAGKAVSPKSNVDLLCADPGKYLDVYAKRTPFTGPSVFFHSQIMMLRYTFDSPQTAATNATFLDLLYATLTAWGLHSNSPKGPKLPEFDQFRVQMAALAPRLGKLATLSAPTLKKAQIASTTKAVWETMDRLTTGDAETKLMYGSKVLHHFLPELVPPIDRTYTGSFFGWTRQQFAGASAQKFFMENYPKLLEISARINPEAERILEDSQGMNTSLTKIVDNAIIGFVLSTRKDIPEE